MKRGDRAPTGSAEDRQITDWVEEHDDDLVAFRRHLHANPELSGEEYGTTAMLCERLVAAGWSPTVLDSGTGLICDIGADGSTPRIAIRGDIDALAMDEDNDVPYRSRVAGVAHACGHDVHSTVVLGSGLALADSLVAGGHSVRLIFEPAEEQVPGGAMEVIASGWLDGIDSVYGLHCDPKIDVGHVGTRRGAITWAADLVEISLHGPGGHTARPEQTVDMVREASSLALELPRLVSERAPGEVLLSFGALQTGEACNVVPSHARLGGSLRTPDPQVWAAAETIVASAVAEILEDTGLDWQIEHRRGVPPVINHDRQTDLVEQAVRDSIGPDALVETPQSRGGDSFAWYLEATGGTYVRLGTHDPELARRVDLHSGEFDVDESAIGIGVRVLASVVLADLGSPHQGISRAASP